MGQRKSQVSQMRRDLGLLRYARQIPRPAGEGAGLRDDAPPER